MAVLDARARQAARRRRGVHGCALGLVVVLAAACANPISVKRVPDQDVYQPDSASVLESGEPSRFTRIAIHRAALDDTFATSRPETIRALHQAAIENGGREDLLALAELCFLQGQATGRKSDYLGAAVYAYLFLFATPDESAWAADEWDPRTRIAADVYNRALARAFLAKDDETFVFASGPRALPVGILDVAAPLSALEWPGGLRFETFLPADQYEVEGLASRYRRAGLGAPLIAKRTSKWTDPEQRDLFPPRLAVPATAFLRVEGGRDALRAPRLAATLELHDPAADATVQVDGRKVPLETQETTAFAYLLGHSAVWDFELAGFLRGSDNQISGMYLLGPYVPGRIPVVFVHGTASSPGRWADMYNEIQSDPRTRDRFQFWFFAYNTGNPIPYSASRLRASIHDTIERVDPEHKDPALNHMVVMGHSQGGLLTRLAVSSSGDTVWKTISDQPFDQVPLDPESRKLAEQMVFFEPVPNVERVVFLATPHGGSYVAGGIFGVIGSKLISVSGDVLRLPFKVITAPVALAQQARAGSEKPKLDLTEHVPTAVDAMMPGSVFVETLGQVPMSERVHKHSIISVIGGAAKKDGGNDGVVEYKSAHIEPVESEVIIDSPHSLQSNPHTVAEVRRILIEHLRVVDAEDPTVAAERAGAR